MCTKHKLCLSFNFCRRRLCELSSEDIHTSNDQDLDSFVSDENCVYIGMPKSGRPRCAVNGVERSIQDDTNPNFCAINLKRRDAAPYSAINEVEVDDDNAWKLVQNRECSKPVHGGNPNCDVRIVLEWYTLVRQGGTLETTQEYCEQLGGALITKFNATNEHLIMIGQKLQEDFWVGATFISVGQNNSEFCNVLLYIFYTQCG